ncbi:MAG: hypothetical protein GY757_30510, partial [bacterium]|nr:hypothetical protein [bacterium]
DDLDRISTINAGNKALASYTYEGKGKVLQKRLQNSLIMDSGYDAGRRPTTMTYKNNSGKTFFNRTMDWNKVNLKKFEKEDGKGEEYSYDSAYRLRKTTDTKRSTQSEFDINGDENIDEFKETRKGIEKAKETSVNERFQLMSFAGKPLAHDKNGNLTNFDYQYVYNWQNQLIEVVTGTGVNVEYKYDALGRRIEKTVTDPNSKDVTRYVYKGYQILEERDDDGSVLKRYTYGNGIDEPVEIETDEDKDGTFNSYLPMQNTIGSVIGVADSTGNLVEKVIYTTYGAPTFIYDEEAPKVDVVRTLTGNIVIRFSEPVDKSTANDA